MADSASRRLIQSALRLLAGAVAASLAVVACDAVPGPSPSDLDPPRITSFDYAPDTIVVSDLPPEQVQDSVVRVPLTVAAQAVDTDSEVASVLFTFEPASNPQATAVGTLAVVEDAPDDVYAAQVQLALPVVPEIYTLRVSAIDTDSLPSNQLTGQVRLLPGDE